MSSVLYNMTREHDNIYYNVSITSNLNNRYTVPKLNIARTENILDKASDYYVSVIRFNIPSTFVPILIFVPSPNHSDINIGAYSITLSYLGFDVIEHLIYVNRNNGVSQKLNDGYYYMFDFQQMVDMINIALSSAMAALLVQFPADPILLAAKDPFMVFNEVTKLFAFYVDDSAFNINNATPIELFLNDELLTLFNSFPTNRIYTGQVLNPNDGKDIQIRFTNQGNNLTQDPNGDPSNTTIYLYLPQEYVTIYNWNPFKKIVITSTSLPMLGENIGSTGNNLRTILTDFVPSVSADEFRTVYQYFPTSQYRLVDLTTDGPLKAFDINVWWQDIQGVLHLIYLPWNSQIEVKIAFLKKDLYKENPIFIDQRG